MELEEMKQMWQQHDRLLNETRMLNEKLLQQMVQGRYKTAISKMLNYEYMGLSLCAILALLLVMQIKTMSISTPIGVCYLFGLFIITASMIMCVYKIRLLRRIDINTNTVSETAAHINQFHYFMIKERFGGILLMPFILISGLALGKYWGFGENIFSNIEVYTLHIVLGSLVAVISMLVLYKTMYFTNIQEIKTSLKEIETFRS